MQCPTCGPSSRHERAIMRIFLLHILHYFHSSIPSFRHKKAPGLQMQALQTCASRLALRLEPCMARTQDVGQRGRTTIDVVLLLFCIISCSSIPSSRHKKAPGPQMQPRQTCVTRGFALRFRPRNVTNRQSDTLVFCTFCIISCSSNPSFRHKKSTGASNAGAPNMRIAACLAA